MSRSILFVISSLMLETITACTPPSGNGTVNDNDLLDPEVRVDSSLNVATRTGIAMGTNEVAICDGWFPATASNTLIVEEGLSLRVTVTSGEEPRLHILCGQSNFCGEQSDVNEWSLSRFWGTGVCEVYVGAPNEGDEVSYTIQFAQE